jgi:hypothetical protein
MKKLPVHIIMVVLWLSSCQERSPAEIIFCRDIRADQPCIGQDSVFMRNTSMWAQLWLSPGFSDTVITATLSSGKDDQNKVIEHMTYRLHEGQQVVMETFFFDSGGHYELEFRDSRGKLLDRKGFEIW